MNSKSKYSLLAVLIIGIASIGIASTALNQEVTETLSENEDVQPLQVVTTYVDNLYAEEHIPLDYQKSVAADIVKGTIVSKTNVLEYRDVEGNYLKADDPSIVVTEPFFVYELETERSIKASNDAKKSVYTFKVFGGYYNGNTIISDNPEFNVGDNVIVILSEAADGKYQELQTGAFSAFEIEDGMAIGAIETIPELELLDSLK